MINHIGLFTSIVYVNVKSNHPPQVLSNIPKGIESRLSKLSSNIALFDQEKAVYQKALIDSGYQHVLTMTERIQDNVVPSNEMSSHQIPGNNISAGEVHSTRKRRRKIMYFNPPYSCFIRNNIGKYFLNMIKTHLDKEHCWENYSTGTI